MDLLDILDQNKNNTPKTNNSDPEQIDDSVDEIIYIQYDLAHLAGINEQLRTTTNPNVRQTLEATLEALYKHKERLQDIATQLDTRAQYLTLLSVTKCIKDIDQELTWLETLKNIYTVAYNEGYDDAR